MEIRDALQVSYFFVLPAIIKDKEDVLRASAHPPEGIFACVFAVVLLVVLIEIPPTAP